MTRNAWRQRGSQTLSVHQAAGHGHRHRTNRADAMGRVPPGVTAEGWAFGETLGGTTKREEGYRHGKREGLEVTPSTARLVRAGETLMVARAKARCTPMRQAMAAARDVAQRRSSNDATANAK